MKCEYCGSIKKVTHYQKWSDEGYITVYLCDICKSHYEPVVICLCGSTRFYEDFARINLRETLAGNIVLSIGCDTHHIDAQYTKDQKRALDRLHMAKIRMADEVIIINKDNYIGESTARELAMARRLGKVVRFEYPHED